MTSNSLKIKAIFVKDLPDFARKHIAGAAPGTYIAITQQRAEALAANPLAQPEDVGLLAAFEGDELVGYFGMMTVQLQHQGKLHACQWFTTWSAAPHMRGRGVGSALMEAALALDKDFFIVGSAPARKVCARYGFEELEPLQIGVLDFGLAGRMNPVSLLARVVRKLVNRAGGTLDITRLDKAATKTFEGLVGWLSRPWQYVQALKKAGDWPDDLRIATVEQVHNRDDHALDQGVTRLYRDARVVNWMLAKPWVVLPTESASEDLDYYFTDTRPGFGYSAIEIYRDEDYLGYMVFQSSMIGERRRLRVHDVTVDDKTLALRAALKLGQLVNAQVIDMNAAYAEAVKDMPIYSQRERVMQVHPRSADSPLGRAWRAIQQDMADGDMAFT